MRTMLAASALLALSAPLLAQGFPVPGPETPRIQTAEWRPGEALVLTALPQTALTVMLEPGETIQRVALGGSPAWEVAVSAEADSFQIRPLVGAVPASLAVQTDRRAYSFVLETGDGLQAAYVVRMQYGPAQPASPSQSIASPMVISGLEATYRLRGDRSVRPISISDNGARTVIEYAAGQSLPAVFAINAAGDEEVVDGYMRDGRYIIDRVHQELVFRIDKARTTATRNVTSAPKKGGE